jgi:hypothetical protein
MSDPNTLELIDKWSERLDILRQQVASYGFAQAPAHLILQIREAEKQVEGLVLSRTQSMFDARHLEANPPPLAKGLITAVSMPNGGQRLEDLASYQAIDYHRRTLRHCWLIATSARNKQSSEPTAYQLKERFERYKLPCSIHIVENGSDPLEIRDCMQKLLQEIELAGEFRNDELICDITSGTKAMTAGMVLACGTKYPMQYMLKYEDGYPSLPMHFQVDN